MHAEGDAADGRTGLRVVPAPGIGTVPPAAAVAGTPWARGWDRLLALLAGCRPRQWVKNVLVAAAPVAAGRWASAGVAAETLLAAGVFVASSSGTYLINDVADRHRDRVHPVKRMRPVASGRLDPALASGVGGALLVAGPLVALLAGNRLLALVVAGYAVTTLCYSHWLKHVPVAEVLVVAAGFLLRPLAGAAATHIRLSWWFLAVCGSGALMVALGKREAEAALGPTHRPAARRYRVGWLRAARALSSAVMLGCYLGWVATRPAHEQVWAALSAVALALMVVRYSGRASRGDGGAPEQLLSRDRLLQGAALLWLVTFLLGPGRLTG